MKLSRRLTLFDAVLLVIGNVVGAGIFTTSGFLAGELGQPSFFIGIWIIGGLLTLCGALTYAELAAMFPRSGGDYQFLKAAYGPWAGFLLGWISFWIINPGSIAALSIAFVSYVNGFFPFGSIFIEKLFAIGLIIFLSIVNCRGVRWSGTTQDIFTLGNLAMIAVLFTYSGWFVTTYIGGEIKNPGRNLPLSLLAGTIIVTILYTLINMTYLYATPIAELRGTVNVAQISAESLFNKGFARILSIAVVLAIAASINATILAGARIYYAMAVDDIFWKGLKTLHPFYRTPYHSILIQMVLSCLLVVLGTFNQLLSYVVFIMILSSVATGIAHVILRKRKPNIPRPYRTWGYPIVPLVFVTVSLWIAIQIAVDTPGTSLIGILITISGLPFFWKHQKASSENKYHIP